MSCKRMEVRLIAYLDGHAKESDIRAVETHLVDCAACRARVEGFQGVWSMLGELPQHEPSAAFDARLRARLATEPAHQGFWSGILPSPRFALAVTVLAVFCVWLSSRPVQQPAPVGTEAEFRMIQDLPVLENYDLLSSFDVSQPAKPPLKD
jgi:anti-sigma factor RsiW